MRRSSLLQLLGIGLLAAAITSLAATFVAWLPDAAGKEAKRIDFVFWFTTVIAIAVFAAVAAVLAYCIVKFRARPGDDSDGAPIHGHTQLEIIWTAIPAVLVTAISIVSAIVLAQNADAGKNPLRIKVTAQQFAWQFTYPNGQTYGYLTVPKDRHVQLAITAKDVLHSFWVPQLGMKQDAVPGQVNKIVITPTKIGTYPVICTELCGLGHAIMRSRVEVVSRGAFRKFVANKGSTAGEDPALATFNQFGCNGCHTWRPANSTAEVGPDLDKLPEYAKQAKQPLDQFIRASIEDPNAYVQPGFQAGVMPSFKGQIPADKLDQLVKSLSGSGKGS